MALWQGFSKVAFAVEAAIASNRLLYAVYKSVESLRVRKASRLFAKVRKVDFRTVRPCSNAFDHGTRLLQKFGEAWISANCQCVWLYAVIIFHQWCPLFP